MKKRKKFDSSRQRLQGTDVPMFPPPAKPVKESPLKPIPQTKWREKQAELAKTLQSVRKKSDGGSTIPVKPSDHEQCPYCDRFFGPKAYDRHAEWCKEQHTKLKNSNNVNNVARERLQVRTKYRAPLSNKVLTRDKYLPRSRDPSPMSMSRIEVEEPSRTKLPSPALNRSSSLRMSGRSRSMVSKAPSIPPVELRDSRVRNHQSSINVRGREPPHPREPERASLTNGTENAKPKIVNVNQNPKKVSELENERSHKLRKCRSWTSQMMLQPLPSKQAEELQVYSCVLHPLTGKRSYESSFTNSDGKKRSVSVSKSFDILRTSNTYIIERNVVGDCPAISDDKDDTEIAFEPHLCDFDEDEDTGEMISDNILHQSEEYSWRNLPVMLLKIHSSEKLPEVKKRGKRKTAKIKPLQLGFTELKMLCASGVQDDTHEEEATRREEYWDDEAEIHSAATDDFMMWYRNDVAMHNEPNLQYTNECAAFSDTGASQFSFDDNHETLFADLQMFMENSATSECAYSRVSESYHFMPPPNFVKIDAIVEIKDVGTTVDDLEDFIQKQQECKKMIESSQTIQTCALHHESERQFENASVQTALLSPYKKYHQLVFIENSDKHSGESDSLKETGDRRSGSCGVQGSCVDGGDGCVYVVNSKGTLDTYKSIKSEESFYHLSDSNDDSLASYPFSFLNMTNFDENPGTPEESPIKTIEPVHKIATAPVLIESSDIIRGDIENGVEDFIHRDEKSHESYKIVHPTLNDIIALIIDVKNRSQFIDTENMGTLQGAKNVSNDLCNEIVELSQNHSEVTTPILTCSSTQVDFPCLICLKRETESVPFEEDKVSKTSWKSDGHAALDNCNGDGAEQGVFENENDNTEMQLSCVCQDDSLQSQDSVESSDESSDWNVHDTSSSSCSCEDCYPDEPFTKTKVVKYYETVEYRETKRGTSTTKTSVQELPPLRNPPKRLVAKTIKKEIRPVAFSERKEFSPKSRHSNRLNGSGECLKLPPIKRRFERQPCSLTRASSGEGDAPRAEPSKFCHECGSKYPVQMAKFCCNCGIRRIAI